MKIRLKDLYPNPFKKEINGGKLSKEKVSLLAESIEKDGFWDNVICRKKDGKYEIAYGHHRLEAARQVLGDDYSVDIPVKDLSDEKMLRILGNENCMQNEEYAIYQVDQVLATKRFLEKRLCPAVGHIGKKEAQGIGVRQISEFLGEKNWSKSKVSSYISLHSRLDPTILQEMKNNANRGGNDVSEISIRHAMSLASIKDKKKQVEVAKEIKDKKMSSVDLREYVKEINNPAPKPSKRSEGILDSIIRNKEGEGMVININELVRLFNKLKISRYNYKQQEVLRKMVDDLRIAINHFMDVKMIKAQGDKK